MYTLDCGCFFPYKYEDYKPVLECIKSVCLNSTKVLTREKRTKGHLMLRCPLSRDIINVYATEKELDDLEHYIEVEDLYII